MSSPLELLPNTYRIFFGRFLNLTKVQKDLIYPILQKKDVILQESTGGGKTEAVLAPATENLIKERRSFTVVYIVPTRALALDMNRRIKPLYKQLGLKAGIRTGDGKDFQDAQPDLLIMTPESLDVLLGSENQDNHCFIKKLQVMIIDEVHTFIQSDRGYHLSYLRHRILRRSLKPLQTVALSATLGNPKSIIHLLSLKESVLLYRHMTPQYLQPYWIHLEDLERELPLFFDDLYLKWKCQKILVFTNTRKDCENLHHMLAKSRLFSRTLFLHYSNLSTKERRLVESSFRKSKKGVCVATTTLELGIDIGDVEGVILFGPPSSSMAFLQRIGRGSRRKQIKSFWGICHGSCPGLQLIKFLALYELAKEGRVEAINLGKSYSILAQQIVSCLYAKKQLSLKSLQHLFKKHSDALSEIFSYLAQNKWLRPTKKPNIYEGETFYYSALKRKSIWSNLPLAGIEYDVILDEKKVAMVPYSVRKQLEVGSTIRLTGKTLKIVQIEEKKESRRVYVKQSNKSTENDPFWSGFGVPVSFEVSQKMGEILLTHSGYRGLLKRTQRLLEEEREKINQVMIKQKGIYIHKTEKNTYRYETFLGTVGNFVLYHMIQGQLEEKFLVCFDELGIESHGEIPFHNLDIFHTSQDLEEWVSFNLPLFRQNFSWNQWLKHLPEKYQQEEIFSRIEDPRILEVFKSCQRLALTGQDQACNHPIA